jgi:hypothetical protein
MPINPTTLKALIDTQITNETVDFAITPTEVGSRMKDTIDYTTEQIAGIPDATESTKGIAQLASTVEVGAGTNGTKIVTPVKLKAVLDLKQATLVSGTNIKTINGSTILGIGDLVVGGGGTQVIKMQKTLIFSSEILDLHTTKIKIITGEAGKIKYLSSYIIDYDFGTVAYTKTGTGNLALYYGSYGQIGTIFQPFVGATASRKYQYIHYAQLDMQFFSGEEDINIGLSSGTYNDGDGNITIYAVYTEVTL